MKNWRVPYPHLIDQQNVSQRNIFWFLFSFCSFFFSISYSFLSLFLLTPFLCLKWQSHVLWILHWFELMLNKSERVPPERLSEDKEWEQLEVYLDSQWRLSRSRQIISETHWDFGHWLIQGPWQPSSQDLLCSSYVFASLLVALAIESSLVSPGVEAISSCWGPVPQIY